jgi:hypothetical protein
MNESARAASKGADMSEQEPSALRECPFCGGKADLHIDGLYNVVIECEGCHGVYTGWPLRSQLLQAWNRRDGEAARVAEAVAAERARWDGVAFEVVSHTFF